MYFSKMKKIFTQEIQILFTSSTKYIWDQSTISANIYMKQIVQIWQESIRNRIHNIFASKYLGHKEQIWKEIISNKMLLIALLNWLSHDVWNKKAGKYAITIKSVPYQPTYMGLWTAIQILIWDILSFSYKYKYDQAKFLGIFFPKNAVSKALCFGFRRSQNRSLTSWSSCCCFLVFPNNKWFLLLSFLLFEMCRWHLNKVTEVNLKATTEDECLFYSSWNSYLLPSLFPPICWCFNCSSANEELFNIKKILKK